MTSNRHPRSYWDEAYASYWRECVNTPGGAPTLAIVESFLSSVPFGRVGSIALDVGTGLGRLLPSIQARGYSVVGVDLSWPMLSGARRGTSHPALLQAAAERLPLRSGVFDLVVCWAVYEALRQEEALAEFARILRPNGWLLISGKGDDYHDDDEAAHAAELGARAKGHPNSFTNYEAFAESLKALDLEARLERFFERRGDLADGRFSAARPARFYEYVIIAQRVGRTPPHPPALVFAQPESRTCRRKTQGE